MDWIGKGVRKIVSVKQPFDSFWLYFNQKINSFLLHLEEIYAIDF